MLATPPKNKRLLSACIDDRFQFDTRVDPPPPLETLAFSGALKAVDFVFPHYEMNVRNDGVVPGQVYGFQRR